LFGRAVELVGSSRKASTSFLQRQLQVGYNRAARLMEEMEEAGMVSAPDHVGKREVLIPERD
jgi:S-DNA-T family DNA segregation ATPase FtsK/SpoIIIE